MKLNRLSHLLNPVPPAPKWSLRRRALVWGIVLAAFGGSLAVLWASYRNDRADLKALITAAAARHGLDADLVEAVVIAESRGNPRAVSPAQAYGLMQLRIPTASEMAGRNIGIDDLFDARLNLDLGCRYLASLLRRFEDVRLALMAYNAGPTRVNRWMRETKGDIDEIAERVAYRETRRYLRSVLSYARQ